jgi:hypothetical protein
VLADSAAPSYRVAVIFELDVFAERPAYLLACFADCYLRYTAKIKHLECSRCGVTTSADKPRTVCEKCAGSLYVKYDLTNARIAAP